MNNIFAPSRKVRLKIIRTERKRKKERERGREREREREREKELLCMHGREKGKKRNSLERSFLW